MEFYVGLLAFALVLIPIILAVINFGRTRSSIQRIAHLERLVLFHGNRIAQLERSVQPSVAKPEPQTAGTVVAEQRLEQPAAPEPVEHPIGPREPQTLATPEFAPPALQSVSRQSSQSRTTKEWEALIGGKILNRIGALALVIGMGFFLKYAFDNNWISETVRVLMGGVAGGALLLFAERMYKKDFTIFSQGLVGAGIAILYLSVYAAFNYYHLVPQVAAFVLMSCVTMLSLWLALKYDSLAVALLGWAGGFLTPIMLSTGVANEIGLFTYLALLDAGFLAIVVSKEKWIVLEALTLTATSLMYFLWFSGDYSPEKFVPTLFFLVIFWLLFFGVEVVRLMRGNASMLVVRNLLASAVPVLFFTGLYNLLEPDHHSWMGFATLFLAVPYYVLFSQLWKKLHADSTGLQRLILTAVVLLFTATAIQFERFETVIAWSLESALIVWAGTSWKLRSLWIVGVAMLAVGLSKLLFSYGGIYYEPHEEFRLLFSIRALAFVALAGATYSCSLIVRKRGEKTLAESVSTALDYGWCVIIFLFLTVETNDLFERWMLYTEGLKTDLFSYRKFLTLANVWMGYAVLLSFWGMRQQRDAVRYSSLGVSLLAFVVAVPAGISFVPIEYFSLLGNYRVLTLAVVIVGMIVQTRMQRGHTSETKSTRRVVGALSLAVVALAFVMLTGETRDFFQQRIQGLTSQSEWPEGTNQELDRLENMKQLSLSGVWLFSSIAMMVVGFWRRLRNLRLVAIGVFAFTIVKIFIYDLSFLHTLYRIFSFMGLGVILLGVSYLYQKFKNVILGDSAELNVTEEAKSSSTDSAS